MLCCALSTQYSVIITIAAQWDDSLLWLHRAPSPQPSAQTVPLR